MNRQQQSIQTLDGALRRKQMLSHRIGVVNECMGSESVFQDIPALGCICGLDGIFRHVEGDWMGELGYSDKELQTKSYINFVYEADREKTENVFQRILSGEKIKAFQNRWMHKDGRLIRMTWVAAMTKDNNVKALAYAQPDC